MTDFVSFQKIPRLRRPWQVTEKLDGSNAQIAIQDYRTETITDVGLSIFFDGEYAIWAGSRNRWITLDDDNFGFAAWVHANAVELLALGPGRHFGEWWGSGIQRGYGLPKGERRFSLFNTKKWNDPAVRPACCHVVPTIVSADEGYLDPVAATDEALQRLEDTGSFAAPFLNPEGVIAYQPSSGILFKRTVHKDLEPKGAQ